MPETEADQERIFACFLMFPPDQIPGIMSPPASSTDDPGPQVYDDLVIREEVETTEIERLESLIPEGAYGVRFEYCLGDEVVEGGGVVTGIGFFGGTVRSLSEIQDAADKQRDLGIPHHLASSLADKMQELGWGHVIQTRLGPKFIRPFTDDDEVLVHFTKYTPLHHPV